jgi:alpha-galactosidase
LRLESNDDEVFAEVFVAPDASRFVLFCGQSGASDRIAARPFSLAGLDADTLYEVSLVNPEDIPKLLNRNQSSGFMRGEPVRLSGAALMAGALRTPNPFPHTMMVFKGTRVSQAGGRT